MGTADCRHLWQRCTSILTELGNGSEACLRLQQVQSLAALEQQQGPYDAVVVAAGAAAALLPEVGQPPTCCICRHWLDVLVSAPAACGGSCWRCCCTGLVLMSLHWLDVGVDNIKPSSWMPLVIVIGTWADNVVHNVKICTPLCKQQPRHLLIIPLPGKADRMSKACWCPGRGSTHAARHLACHCDKHCHCGCLNPTSM